MKGLVLLMILLFTIKSYSQGFDWQISPRLPFEIPQYYLGATISFSKIHYNGSLLLTESFVNCAKFESGSGRSYSFGFSAEYWFTAFVPFFIELKYLSANGLMKAMADSFPILVKQIPKIVKVQNEMSFSYSYIVLTIGGKLRLLETNFFIGANLDFAVKTHSKYDVFEQVLSPAEYHFVDFSQRRKLFNGLISDLSFFAISPKLTFGYNATLGVGIYATPRISFEFPFINYSTEEKLRLTTFSFGVSFLYGIW